MKNSSSIDYPCIMSQNLYLYYVGGSSVMVSFLIIYSERVWRSISFNRYRDFSKGSILLLIQNSWHWKPLIVYIMNYRTIHTNKYPWLSIYHPSTMILFVWGMTISILDSLGANNPKICRQVGITLTPTLGISYDL